MELTIDKRIKKVIETVIIESEEEFKEKFGEQEYQDALKHRAKVTKLALEDDLLKEIIKDEVEDCIGAYLLSRPIKKEKKKKTNIDFKI